LSTRTPQEQAQLVVTIEDGMSEDDWEGWKLLIGLLEKMPARGRRSFRHQCRAPFARDLEGVANLILIKVNAGRGALKECR